MFLGIYGRQERFHTASTQLRRIGCARRMAQMGQNRKRAIQKVSVCSAPKRTSTPPRPAFRNRPTADLAQTDCAGHGAHGAEHHSFTGVTTGAPLPFSNTTTNLAGSVLLALRPTT